MTCKDCVHYDVCYYVDQTMTIAEIEEDGAENDCRHFISLVECDDCKHWKTFFDAPNGCCDKLNVPTDGNYFCRYGERKDND